MSPIPFSARLLLLAVLVAAGGCAQRLVDAPPADGQDAGDGDARLAEARARWAASGPGAYRMTLHRSCFCPEDYRGPFAVTVRNGTVASVEMAGRSLPADRAVTVDALFDLLAEAYAEDAELVRVTYDDALGYPTELYIDRSAQMADEEIGYTVSSLARL